MRNNTCVLCGCPTLQHVCSSCSDSDSKNDFTKDSTSDINY